MCAFKKMDCDSCKGNKRGGVNKFLESYPLSGLIKGGRVEFRVKFFGEYLTNVGSFVVQVVIKIICSTSSMFSTVFIDISLIFVQLCLEDFGKTVRDPPLLLPSREYLSSVGLFLCSLSPFYISF